MNREIFDKLLTKSAQTPREFFHFINFLEAHKIKYNRIIEIGSYYGGTTNVFKEMLSEDGLLISIDIDEHKTMTEAMERFKDNEKVKFVIGDSNIPETVDIVKDIMGNKKCDLLFIDGGHSPENIRLDYELFSPLVETDGIVSFHDSIRNGSVRRFIEGIVDFYEMDSGFDFSVRIGGSAKKGHCGIDALVKGDL